MATKPVLADLVTWLKLRSPVDPGTCAQLTESLATAIDEIESRVDNTLIIAQGAGDLTSVSGQYPQRVRTAILMDAARINKRPSSAEGVTGFGELGVMRVTPSDPDIERLIGRFLKSNGFS